MYKKNQSTQQPLLLSDVSDLPQRTLKHLKASWAETFRKEVFLRIPEDIFQVLYGNGPSRPNVPVNLLVGLEILKEWRGWSDEEMYDHFLFDLQVRYALGCDRFGEGDFDLRTTYYFRNRLSQYALKTGKNLLTDVFQAVTDEQIEKYKVKTHLQRMDSTQILSNIADLSRLELLVEALQRLYRVLSPAEQEQYREVFQPYIKETAGQYTYRIHGKEAVWEHIEQVGHVLAGLLEKLKAYQEEPIYQTVQRFFDENFQQVETQVKAKTNAEITPGCLQSFDDLEATYRVKCHRAYKGYVGNLTETCDPKNPLQLITDVQVEPNRASDIALLRKALADLQERTELKTLVTDGGYVSPEVDILLMKSGIEQITTGLTGTLPSHQDGKKALSDFEMELDPEANVTRAICPQGQSAVVQMSISQKSFRLKFDPKVCLVCPLLQAGQCPVQTDKKKTLCFLTVPKERAISS
jgi:ABC-type transporter MlaC component